MPTSTYNKRTRSIRLGNEKVQATVQKELEELTRRAEEDDDGESQYELGCHYEHGYYNLLDNSNQTEDQLDHSSNYGYHAQSFEWYERAAEGGHPGAMYMMATCYEKGNYFADPDLCHRWYRRAYEASKRLSFHPEQTREGLKMARIGLYWLAICYRDGKCDELIERDYYPQRQSSFKNNNKKKKKKHQQQEMQKSEELALKYMEKSAVQSYGPAQYEMGKMYASGSCGTTTDLVCAVEWFQAACGDEDISSSEGINTGTTKSTLKLLAQYELGKFYATGKGQIRRSPYQAVVLLGEAAVRGHVGAQKELQWIVQKLQDTTLFALMGPKLAADNRKALAHCERLGLIMTGDDRPQPSPSPSSTSTSQGGEEKKKKSRRNSLFSSWRRKDDEDAGKSNSNRDLQRDRMSSMSDFRGGTKSSRSLHQNGRRASVGTYSLNFANSNNDDTDSSSFARRAPRDGRKNSRRNSLFTSFRGKKDDDGDDNSRGSNSLRSERKGMPRRSSSAGDYRPAAAEESTDNSSNAGSLKKQHAGAQMYGIISNGTNVTLRNLRKRMECNGARGTVVGYDADSGRYTVSMDSSSTFFSGTSLQSQQSSMMRVKQANLLQHAAVTVTGIEQQPEMNGKVGTIVGWDELRDRYKVAFVEYKPHKTQSYVSLKPQNTILPVNTVVTIVKVKSKPELNGQSGTIIAHAGAKSSGSNRAVTAVRQQRYQVRVNANQIVKLKFENVVL